MPDPKRPPHPAKIGPARAAQRSVKRACPPHPATVQRHERPGAAPPHPATVQKKAAQPARQTAKPPHPATVQRMPRPAIGTPAGRSPYPLMANKEAMRPPSSIQGMLVPTNVSLPVSYSPPFIPPSTFTTPTFVNVSSTSSTTLSSLQEQMTRLDFEYAITAATGGPSREKFYALDRIDNERRLLAREMDALENGTPLSQPEPPPTRSWFRSVIDSAYEMLFGPSPPPVDAEMETYSVNWMPWILDWNPYAGGQWKWKTYDPAEIDGVGLLQGVQNGKLVGLELKTKQSTYLTHTEDESGHYSWVFTPGDAIIYRWNPHEELELRTYTRHSQLGRGKPVRCAGEFKLKKVTGSTPALEYIIAETNDSSGHYKPDGGKCMAPVIKKMQRLGMDTSKTKFYTRTPIK